MNIKIIYLQLSEFGSAASTIHPQFGPAIVVNSDEAPWRINFTLAHELFHILTWDTYSPKELEKNSALFDALEKKAERFASSLLLPEVEVRQEILSKVVNDSLDDADVIEVAREFGVSTQALLFRMFNMKIIPWEVADEARNNPELTALDRRIRSVDWDNKPESERFSLLAVKCLRKGLLSRGKFAEFLGINRAAIEYYLEMRGLTDTEGRTFEVMAS